MRLITLFLFLFAVELVGADQIQNPLQAPTADGVVQKTVRTGVAWWAGALTAPYLVKRCTAIINCGNGVSDSAGCFKHIGATTSEAQIGLSGLIGGSKEYFVDHLSKLGQDQEAINHLKHLKSLLDQPGLKFNLWSVTYKSRLMKRDKRRAMMFLATFFQDRGLTSTRLSPEVQSLLDDVSKPLFAKIRSGEVEAYPPGVDSKKTGIYHFYSVGWIASEMQSKGIPKRYAAALPYSVNEAVELLKNRTESYQDIYSGYAGVQFALSYDEEKFSGPSYQEFKNQYKSNGAPAVSRFLKKGLGGAEVYCNDSINYEAFKKSLPTIDDRPVETIK